MSDRLIFNCTHGKDDPERATLPFVAANIAATAGQDAVVLCTIDAVWLGTDGGTVGIASPGLPALSALFGEYVENGGQVWLCGARAGPHRVACSLVRAAWGGRACRPLPSERVGSPSKRWAASPEAAASSWPPKP